MCLNKLTSESTSGVISSEHPYAAGFGCMYTVTSPEPIEFRIRKMEIKVTENCLFDNIQLYDGHKELGWICKETVNQNILILNYLFCFFGRHFLTRHFRLEIKINKCWPKKAENKFLNWTKVDSGDLAVYFEGYSGKHYGFDLEWRSQIKTTTTTPTTTTTTTRTMRTARRKKYGKRQKNKLRNQVGFIETVKRRYQFLIKRREQIDGNSILQRYRKIFYTIRQNDQLSENWGHYGHFFSFINIWIISKMWHFKCPKSPQVFIIWYDEHLWRFRTFKMSHFRKSGIGTGSIEDIWADSWTFEDILNFSEICRKFWTFVNFLYVCGHFFFLFWTFS